MKQTESIEEGWVKFRRKYFNEGFIDCWIGDSANDPNCIGPLNFQLNSFSQFFRLNGQDKWFSDNEFIYGFSHMGEMCRLHLTAKQYWDTYIQAEIINNQHI